MPVYEKYMRADEGESEPKGPSPAAPNSRELLDKKGCLGSASFRYVSMGFYARRTGAIERNPRITERLVST